MAKYKSKKSLSQNRDWKYSDYRSKAEGRRADLLQSLLFIPSITFLVKQKIIECWGNSAGIHGFALIQEISVGTVQKVFPLYQWLWTTSLMVTGSHSWIQSNEGPGTVVSDSWTLMLLERPILERGELVRRSHVHWRAAGLEKKGVPCESSISGDWWAVRACVGRERSRETGRLHTAIYLWRFRKCDLTTGSRWLRGWPLKSEPSQPLEPATHSCPQELCQAFLTRWTETFRNRYTT